MEAKEAEEDREKRAFSANGRVMMDEFEQIDKNTFVYRPSRYDGPKAQNAIPSKECKEYHKNSFVQFILSEEMYKKLSENSDGQ